LLECSSVDVLVFAKKTCFMAYVTQFFGFDLNGVQRCGGAKE